PLGLERLGFRLVTEPSPAFEDGGRSIQVHLGAEPYPEDFMDLRAVPGDFDAGRAFLALSLGLPELEQRSRLMLQATYPDPWGAQGGLRRLSQLAAALLPLATGVVLNRAGELVCDRDTFQR